MVVDLGANDEIHRVAVAMLEEQLLQADVVEIVDAARIDGNSVYGVYRRIMLPLGAPALLSVGILNALFCWNDVLIALLMMPSAEHRTLMVGVTS